MRRRAGGGEGKGGREGGRERRGGGEVHPSLSASGGAAERLEVDWLELALSSLQQSGRNMWLVISTCLPFFFFSQFFLFGLHWFIHSPVAMNTVTVLVCYGLSNSV